LQGFFESQKTKARTTADSPFPFKLAQADSSGSMRKAKTRPRGIGKPRTIAPAAATLRREAPKIAIEGSLNGEVDGGGLNDGSAGGGYVDRVGAGGEAAWTETVGVDSAAAAAAEHTQSGEREEQD
jgi:hypothetical protein